MKRGRSEATTMPEITLDLLTVIVTGLVALLSSGITAFATLRISRQQSEATLNQTRLELQASREADERAWRRKVRGEPLLVFRGELVVMSQKYTTLVQAVQLQHTRVGISDEYATEILIKAQEDWNNYAASGRYEQCRLSISDKEILDKAWKLWGSLVEALTKTEGKKIVFRELTQVAGDIAELQELISQRLEEI